MTFIDHGHQQEGANRSTSFGDEPDSRASSRFSTDLYEFWSALADRRRLIILTTLAALFAALAYVWITPPQFSATAQVLIDPRKRDIVKQEIVPSGLGQSSLGADTFLLDSQVELMLSDGLLRALVAKRGLASDPEFAAPGSDGVLRLAKDLVKFVLAGPMGASLPGQSGADRALETLRRQLSIKREGNTYVINVRVRSKDPEKSAAIANTLLELYLDRNVQAARSRIEYAEGLLTGRLVELRRAAIETRKTAETFRAQNGLLRAKETPMVEQQMLEINEQLAAARANTRRALAYWEQVRSLKGAGFERALASGVLKSELIETLQAQYSVLAGREASLARALMPAHPGLRAVRDEKNAVRQEIARELSRLAGRAKSDYEVARANESSLAGDLANAELKTAKVNQAAVKLRELEQDAQAASEIYTEFLSRAKDAREQAGLPTDSARIISAAVPPTKPTWPILPLIYGLALLAGLMAGVFLSWLLHILSGPLRRA